MDHDKKLLLVDAVKHIKLVDIALYSCQLDRQAPFSEQDDTKFIQQNRRHVNYYVEEHDDEKVLLVKVELGSRMVNELKEDEEEHTIYFEIEASFIAAYNLDDPESKLTNEHLDAFSQFNSVH